jgi:hypothetical protein
MVLAYDYPLLGVFWTMLIFFLWVAWLVVLFRVFADIFRSHQMGGFAKALWSIFVLFVPFLGVFIYLIVHGKDMTQRDIAEASSREAAFQSYVRDVAGASAPSTADEIAKLAELHARGVLTDEEFAHEKNRQLGAI